MLSLVVQICITGKLATLLAPDPHPCSCKKLMKLTGFNPPQRGKKPGKQKGRLVWKVCVWVFRSGNRQERVTGHSYD